MIDNFREQLNSIYTPMVHKSKELIIELKKLNNKINSKMAFYNGHSHKDSKGVYKEDAYPISVVSIDGLCDIEFNFDSISVTTKISKNQIKNFDFKLLEDKTFEIYGVEDYLCDYGTTYEEVINNTMSSDETSFFISVYFSSEEGADYLAQFILKMQDLGCFY